jgi:hypothetical protein
MRTSARLLPAALAATVVLAAAVGQASARRLMFSEQTIRTAMMLRLEAAPAATTNCPVTLEGSFHSRTLSKVCGQLIGYITAAATNKLGCAVGQRTLFLAPPDGTLENTTLPWHVRFDSFEGTLPRITGLRMAIVGFGIKVLSGCEYQSTTTRPAYVLMTVAAETGRVEAIRFLEEPAIPRRPPESLCSSPEARLSGRELLTVLGATTSVTVRLVQ